MPASNLNRFLRALLATLPPLVAAAVQWLFWAVIQPYAWFLFYPAVFLSSWIGGLAAGLRATLIATVLVWWFFIPPELTLLKGDPKHVLPALVFCAIGVLFSVFHERLRQANRRVTQLYERARELDELKTQFFANVSHELRTPLTLILGPAQRMLAAPDTPAAARRDLEVILHNGRTLLRHVNDLLDLSKLEAGQVGLQYADTDVARLVRFVAGNFEVLAQEKGIAYHLEAPQELPAQVDPDRLRRVLLNLLSNAFKFTPAGGRVRVTLREEAGQVILEVADSGPGIPADKREAVFERFRQLEGGASRRFGGTGLGLAIARDFVALHGGTISAGEAPEGGALFVLTLPRFAPAGAVVHAPLGGAAGADETRQAVAELREPKVAAPPGLGAAAAPLVLVVEDNPEMNRFICDSLAGRYRVAAAGDGREGLSKALALRPDLIVSDIMMPGMSGDELVRALRGRRELDAVPIVILSAKADDALRVRLLREGVQDYLTKPFSKEELLARVGTLLARKAAEDGLRRSEERYRALIEQAPDGIFIADLQGRYTEVNTAGSRMLGYGPEEIVGKTILDLIPPDEAGRLWREKEKLLAGGILVSEWLLKRKDGTYLPVEVSARITPDGHWQGFVRDIAERKRAQEHLRLAAIVFDSTNEGIMVADAATRIVAVNKALERITGYGAEEVLGRRPSFQSSGRQDREFYRQMWAVLDKTGQWQGEIWNRRKNGEIFPAWENISAVTNSQGQVTHYVGVLSDISAIKEAEERLTQLAHHDALTGLPNRLLFAASLEKSLEKAARRRHKLALLFFDLDRFKLINDTLGHAAGDRLLQEVAARLKGCLRAEDLVARLGGDEFTILLEEIAHTEDIAHLAEKIIAAVRRPIALDGREIATSASIGISLFPDDARSAADLARAAAAAMFRAKERGRNTFEFYTAELTARAMDSLALENGLRRALAHSEFLLYYQPQIELVSGRLVGLEALLRWRHPEQGLVAPERFIAVAEESGLIEAIGDWVIRQACAQARAWLDQGLRPGRIAINVSGRQMLYDRVFDTARAALRDNALPAEGGDIELEMTETVLQSVEHSVEVLERLRELGVQVAIDDFGTGYSSLSHLKHLPVDALKIDQLFLRNIPEDADNRAITAAIVSMGHSLGLRVIAEGVESEGQLAFLRMQGCDEVQGNLFGAAVPAEVIARRLHAA